ncbi:histidinol-phosphate transaminase [Caldicellulosiruptoraceae bacterium PP1]
MFKEFLKQFKNYEVDYEDYYIKVDANENLLDLPEELAKKIENVIVANLNNIRLYPEINSQTLINKLSQFYNLSYDNFVVGNGSDQLIQIIVQSTSTKNDTVLSLNPSFVMYKISSLLQEANWKGINWEDNWKLPIDEIIDTVNNNNSIKVLFIDTPNNPTGIAFNEDELSYLINKLRDILIVIDGAYSDYFENNYLGLCLKYKNTLLLKTFSKIGFAGIRCGYAIANKNIIEFLNKVKPPYNVNTLTHNIAIEILENFDLLKNNIEIIKNERQKYITKLSEKYNILDSKSNFIAIINENAHLLYDYLLQNKIKTKLFKLNNTKLLRITISDSIENDIIIDRLLKWK